MRWLFGLVLCLAPVVAQGIDETARQFERAARNDPSENNLFDLGSYLLQHNGFAPGLTVFEYGINRYPTSARLRVGLGVALYSLGRYDEAVERLCQAVDLDPRDTKALDFLGKMQDISPQYKNEVGRRLAHFVELYPKNAAANYYYALSLGERGQSYFETAVQLDPSFTDAHYHLGLLQEEAGATAKAILQYQVVIEQRPDFSQAHYHLARLYQKSGKPDLARKEFALLKALKAQQTPLR
jgi:tetratricopeptide (TPR) repeat protein